MDQYLSFSFKLELGSRNQSLDAQSDIITPKPDNGASELVCCIIFTAIASCNDTEMEPLHCLGFVTYPREFLPILPAQSSFFINVTHSNLVFKKENCLA